MILIYSGLPASGKTKRATEWVLEDPRNRLRVNYDDLRVRLYGCKGASYFRGKDIKHREAMVKAEALKLAEDFLNANPIEHSVVIDNTNLTVGARAPWENLGKRLNVPVVLEDVDTPVKVCVERDLLREGDDRVGRAVIERMALTTGWIDWADRKVYPLQKFVVVDIDGTLSDPTHRLHHIQKPKDSLSLEPHKRGARWDLFHAEVDKDPAHLDIVSLVKLLHGHYHILIVSGRSPEHGCGIKTEDWLNTYLTIPHPSKDVAEKATKYGWPPVRYYEHLFMRAAGDYRPDYVHKQEILDLLPKDRIAFVIDDRQQVVDMWRRNGLRCLQVNEGDF